MTSGPSGYAPEGPLSRKRLTGSDGWAAVGFLTPTYIGFALFVLAPMLGAIALSFFDWNLLAEPQFAGLSNYRRLFSDPRLIGSYTATLWIGLLLVVANVVGGLLLAYLVDYALRGRLKSVFRMTYLFPFVISAAAVSLIWSFLLNKDLGLVNYVLGLIGIDRVNWLGSSTAAPWSVFFVAAWRSVGFSTLIYIAGLQGVPKELKEAATVDGADSWNVMRRIALPLISPTVLFVLVISTINAFQLFAEPFVLTRGGPGDATRTVVVYIYDRAFSSFELGYASTIALTLFVVLLTLTILQFRLSSRWTFYD